jgi:hypothetical protein
MSDLLDLLKPLMFASFLTYYLAIIIVFSQNGFKSKKQVVVFTLIPYSGALVLIYKCFKARWDELDNTDG